MAKISLAGFADPVKRPRYIIWTGVVVLLFAAVMVPVLGITSTRWFCSQGCHKVQDDTIVSYSHSSHSNISCMACHMPVNANPVIFLLHKAEALGELAQTVTNNYELPLNKEDEVALTMKSEQCTQCHNIATRKVSPSPGIKINHQVHLDKNVPCTICHNRIAHNEDFNLQLKDPKTGKQNQKHTDFMSMTACFRCHGQEKGSPAPGACPACHTPGFELKPPSHLQADFFPAEHAKLAKESITEFNDAMKEAGDTTVTVERKAEWTKADSTTKETLGQRLLPAREVFYCGTCHAQKFCDDCHGTPMPHSDEFKNPKNLGDSDGHPVLSTKIPDKCVMCHTKADPAFCDKCHHGTQVNYSFTPEPWLTQHPKAVAKSGVKVCQKCHVATFCANCHTQRRVFPASHQASTWVHSPKPTVTSYGSIPATPWAGHALAALAPNGTDECAVCHGPGGPSAPFCAACHKTPMPHTAAFKTTPGVHRTQGLQNQALCANCHRWPELCSNCHHVGASTTTPWLQVHGRQVEASKDNAATCAKCHADKSFCQDCHQANKVMPATHKAANFLKQAPPQLGVHAALYQADSVVCTYCHAGDPNNLPASAFCMNCHKLAMPHPQGWGLKEAATGPTGTNGGAHADQFKAGKLTTPICANCHTIDYCDTCHHKNGFVAGQNWIKTHPTVVNKAGTATGCYDSKNGGTTGCHAEAFCSDCHVNRAAALKKAGL